MYMYMSACIYIYIYIYTHIYIYVNKHVNQTILELAAQAQTHECHLVSSSDAVYINQTCLSSFAFIIDMHEFGVCVNSTFSGTRASHIRILSSNLTPTYLCVTCKMWCDTRRGIHDTSGTGSLCSMSRHITAWMWCVYLLVSVWLHSGRPWTPIPISGTLVQE